MSFQEKTDRFNLEDITLIEKYISTLVNSDKEEKSYNPWLILQNIQLAKEITIKLQAAYDFSSVDGICILANSGIPLGVMLAQAVNKPMYFYRRQPWSIEDKEDVPYFIFPEPKEGIRVALVDSNIGDGTTSGACVSFLEKYKIVVACCITPISFISQAHTPIERNIKYVTLANSDEIKDSLLRIFDCSKLEEVFKIVINRKEEEIPVSGINNNAPKLSLKAKLSTLYRSIEINPKPIDVLDVEISKFLSSEFGSKESDIWSFFTNPNGMRIACSNIAQKIGLENFEIIFGTGFFGTIFSIALAWHSSFNKRIYSTYLLAGWETLPTNTLSKKSIIISGRLRTGIIIKRLLIELEKIMIKIDNVIAIRYIPSKSRVNGIRIINDLQRKLKDKLKICS